MKKRIRKYCRCHWKKIAWAGIAAPIGVLGTQLDKPYASWCYVAAAAFTILSVLAKGTPDAE